MPDLITRVGPRDQPTETFCEVRLSGEEFEWLLRYLEKEHHFESFPNWNTRTKIRNRLVAFDREHPQ